MLQTFLKLFGPVGQFLAVLLKKGIKEELEILAPIALQAVKAVASDPSLTGTGKFDKAVSSVKSTLYSSDFQNKQKTIATSLINTAIEIAYQNFQAGK